MNINLLKQSLYRHEGIRWRPYDDATGKPPQIQGNLTIGVGHNLTANGLSDQIIDLILNEDIGTAIALLDRSGATTWWRDCDDVRQRVLVELAFNLGARIFGFARMLAALHQGNYSLAADELKKTLWSIEVGPTRTTDLCGMLRDGKDPSWIVVSVQPSTASVGPDVPGGGAV